MTVYTPRTLAERWECSEQHVRNMVERGQLPAFRLGGKLLRIKGDVVEAFECRTGDLTDCAESSASYGAMERTVGATASGQPTAPRQPASPLLSTLELRDLKARR